MERRAGAVGNYKFPKSLALGVKRRVGAGGGFEGSKQRPSVLVVDALLGS